MNGIEYLVDKGKCHRDIKPDNILCRNNEYKLSDLGIGKDDL